MSSLEDDMIVQLSQHEGVERYAYNDSRGFISIAMGRCIDERCKNPLSDAAIEFLTKEQFNIIERDLDRWMPWWRKLDRIRQRVLFDMCYNMGIYGLRQFNHTLMFIQESQYKEAAKAMILSNWYTQVGRRAHRLVEMMETGNEVEYK